MDPIYLLLVFPFLLLLMIVFILIEFKSYNFRPQGTKDWGYSYFFLFLYALVEQFVTPTYYFLGAYLSSMFYITAFIYIQYTISKYNMIGKNFYSSLIVGSLMLFFLPVVILSGWTEGYFLNILFSLVMIFILIRTILFVHFNQENSMYRRKFIPLCISLSILTLYFICRIVFAMDFGQAHADHIVIHTVLFISNIVLLISVSLSISYIYKAYYVEELLLAKADKEKELELITILSETDQLTSIYNRRKIEAIINELISRYQSTEDASNFYMTIMDIDDFKLINDSYGHVKGDQVLESFAKIFSELIPNEGFMGRWGGDEFIMVLQNTTESEIIQLINQAAEQLKDIEFDINNPITFSYGIKKYSREMTSLEFFKHTDISLYASKEKHHQQKT